MPCLPEPGSPAPAGPFTQRIAMAQGPETYFDLGAVFRGAAERIVAAWERGLDGAAALLTLPGLRGEPLASEERTALLIAGGAVFLLLVQTVWLRFNRYRFGRKPKRKSGDG